jgi:hypothetical protein
MNSVIIEEFVNVKAGEAYRLFPFGKIVKGGKVRDITPEFAATVRLPHFKPAIKLGSHEDVTPAGGHMVALEVHADGYESCTLCKTGECKTHGLFVVPEYNDKGSQALLDGAYRYHSPEIIWDGGLENPDGTGAINAPLIMGDALLHTPHLGEAASLYSVEVIESNKEQTNMNENITVPTSLWDKFIAPLLHKEPEVKEVVRVVEPEDYSATKAELETFKAQVELQKAETEKKARVEKFETELKETKAPANLAEILAGLTDEQAGALMKEFRALSEQINVTEIAKEVGTPADAIDDPKAAFNAAVLAVVKEKGINYNAAFEHVKNSQPEMFKSAFTK